MSLPSCYLMVVRVRFYTKGRNRIRFPSNNPRVLPFGMQVHTMMEESAAACVSGDFPQALEKAKEAVSQASQSFVQ